MKRLLFTTAYFDGGYGDRVARWLGWYQKSPLAFDGIVILEDGSQTVPQRYPRWQIDEMGGCIIRPREPVVITYPDHLGRINNEKFPGWARSFFSIPRVCRELGVREAVFVESDACIMSERVFGWINGIRNGWHALWCPKYGIAETSIQVIVGGGLDRLERQNRARWLAVGGRFDGNADIWERSLGIGAIMKEFRGDRYTDDGGAVPANAEYSCQHSWGTEGGVA